MKITKEEFKKTMEGIKQQLEIDVVNHDAFSKILENDYVSGVENVLYGTITELLEILTGDTETQWIQYFIYELDFGKENWRMPVSDTNGSNVPLGTIDDLWNLLIDNERNK